VLSCDRHAHRQQRRQQFDNEKSKIRKNSKYCLRIIQLSLAKQRSFSPSNLLMPGRGHRPLAAAPASLRADPGVHICSAPTTGCLLPTSHFPVIGLWRAPEPRHDDRVCRNQSFLCGSRRYGELQQAFTCSVASVLPHMKHPGAQLLI